MILNEKTNNIEKFGIDDSKKATINQNEIAKLQHILTTGLYSDPVSAVIVEWSNNAIDSVVMSGKNLIENPVLVTLTEEYFSVEDKGLGLSKEEFENVCMSFLSSTKSTNNNAIGFFGIGMKSYLSLNRNAIFTIRKDGVEAKYTAYQGTEFMEYDLIYEKPTEQENGVKCEIKIKDKSEYWEFEGKCIKKLAYYDTVVLNINGQLIENTITRTDLFQFSSQHDFTSMHLCLKDVLYDIDYNKLGISQINLPIAIRFNLNEGLIPTPSRENLIYNEHTKELILSKIKEIANFFVNKYNEENSQEFDTIREIWSTLEYDKKTITLAGKDFDVKEISKYSDIKLTGITVKNYTLQPLKWYYGRKNELFHGLQQIARYKNSIWSTKRMYDKSFYNFEKTYNKFIIVDNVPSIYLKKWCLNKYPGKTLIFLKEGKKIKLYGGSTSYMSILRLNNFPKNQWRGLIQEWQRFEKEFTDSIENLSGIEETSEFIKFVEDYKEEQKANRKSGVYSGNYKTLDKKEGDITISYCRQKSIGYGYMFEKKAIPLHTLYKEKGLTVYFTKESDKELASNLFKFLKGKIKVCFLGKQEVKKVQDIHQFKTYKQFMTDSKVFKRAMSAQLFNELIDTYKTLTKSKIEVVEQVVKPLASKIKILKDYVIKNGKDDVDDDFLNSMKVVAKEHNLYDYMLWDVYTELKKDLEKYSFIALLEIPESWDEEGLKNYKSLVNKLLYHNLITNKQLPDNLEFQFVEKKLEIVEEPEEIMA